MSEVILSEATAPATPPAGKVTLYAKTDGLFYFKADDGVEYPLKTVGAGTGDLLADGSVPLTSNWDVGAFTITGTQFISDIATGTAPLVVASTTEVANLKAATATLADGVTTNANLTGPVTSVGNATAIADKALAIAKLADGTDGELITWSAAGVIETVAVGTATHVLTSNGVGLAPTFQAAAGGSGDAWGDVVDAIITPDADGTRDFGLTGTRFAEGFFDDLDVTTNIIVGGTVDGRDVAADGVILDAIDSGKFNNQVGTTYTIVAGDNGKVITFNNASAIAVTLPDTLDTNFQCTIVQIGAGVPTVTPNTDTINGAGTGVTPDAQWKGLYLSQFAATEWLAVF